MTDNHRPTFTVSPARRPLLQRLTPLAWALVGAGTLVLLLALATAALVLPGCAPEEDWWTPSPSPPAPTAEPPSPTPDVPFPAWWSDQMTQDEEGHSYLPSEVEDQVWGALIGGLGCWNIANVETMPDEWLTRPATETLHALILDAAQYLADDPDVYRVACNGPESLEQNLDLSTGMRLVEFGQRSPVFCDERPTHCTTGVRVDAVGGVAFIEEPCLLGGDPGAPCFRRGDMYYDQAPHQIYGAILDYDEESGTWKIVAINVATLDE